MTVGAIAAFRKDRKLQPREPIVDAKLLREIEEAKAENWTRPLAKERSEATVDTVASKVPTVGQAQTAKEASKASKLWAWVLGIPGAIVTFFKGIVDNFEGALESPMLNAVKEFFADNVLYLALGVVGIAVMIWLKSRTAEVGATAAEESTVESFRDGRLS